MEFIKSSDIKELANPGVVSRQLLNPENSESKRVTITEVHLEAGASQPRHTHEFVYLSVTAPPINFGYAYSEKR